MPDRPTLAARLDDSQWAVLRAAVEQLEEAWRAGHGVDLCRLVPPIADPLQERVLIELIKVDQEYRWQKGQRQKLEDYLHCWPELNSKPHVVAELLYAECLTRAVIDVIPAAEELRSRFPELCQQIDLAAIQAEAETERTVSAAATPLREGPEAATAGANASLPGDVRPLRPGERFGDRYEILALLGYGGMGVVYRARDTRLGREVALKTPQFDPDVDPAVRERFLREGQAASRIRHKNVCTIYDAGQVQGTYYITMAFIEGQSLKTWLQSRESHPREAAEVVWKLARALEAVHAEGIVHRDVNPSNVMIDRDGEPLLTDFGLAGEPRTSHDIASGSVGPTWRSRQAGDVTGTGSPLGTPAYMSPEQATGQAVDARSDIYSLGVLFYQMLTGELPFGGPFPDLLEKITHANPRSPRELRPTLDTRLEQVCLKAMAKDPTERYQSAREMADALGQYLQSLPRAGLLTRHWWLVGIVAAGAVLLLLAMLTLHFGQRMGPSVRDENVPGLTAGKSVSPGVTIAATTPTIIEGGTAASYEVALTSKPKSPVTVTLKPDSQVTANRTSLTLTPANWHVPQTVTIEASDDKRVEGNHKATIAHTAVSLDPDYDEVSIAAVTAYVADNDSLPPGSLSGTVFHDLDGDGSRDPGEPGLAGWIVKLERADRGPLLTFQKPAPAEGDRFGQAVAPLDTRYVLVGAHYDSSRVPHAGAVYMFDALTGNLVQQFHKPAPAKRDYFGFPVAGIGRKVLVGAVGDRSASTNAGAVYLLDALTGKLLLTLHNPRPNPNDNFGYSIALLGGNVIVGAPGEDTDATNAGMAYVFDSSTEGPPLVTFRNPKPGHSDEFGAAVAALGNRVVIGAPGDDTDAADAGIAYLFNGSTGELLLAFHNPSPTGGSRFGYSIAATGDALLIGAPGSDTGVGAVHLFDGSAGALLLSLANPTSAKHDWFGHSVAVVGNWALVGALYDDARGEDAGAAYLFDLATGSLVQTFENPSPRDGRWFGHSLAAVGSNVLIGAPGDDSQPAAPGAAYLFAGPATSDTTGRYQFSGLPPGEYRISPVAPSGYALAQPQAGRHEVTLAAGEDQSGLDFGYALQPKAPASNPLRDGRR
jgi:serine/threonine protein kinase